MSRTRLILLLTLACLVGAGAMSAWNAETGAATRVHLAANDDQPPSVESSPAPADSAPEAALLSDAHWPTDAPTPEQVFSDQPRLLDRELAQLKPRTPGKINLYAVAFAGDGGENVFRNEAEYLRTLFARRFGAAGHIVVLENNPATLATQPLADWSNIEGALDAVAAKMDPSQDILLLYMTTHGSEDHVLLVDMDPIPLDQIGVRDLAAILHEHPFKYKVVIVNACYSGGFIPALRGDDTLVMTAARADRSSFGCGSESELTYFGHAWLVDALNRTDDFIAAFRDAQREIAQWERSDRLAPSEPQIDIGNGIAAQLAAWRQGVTAGAAVQFKPAVPAAASSSSDDDAALDQ